ncbi:hypothetical protein HETIRDRAFT_105596 [Heterobasidion irregulare TC 32-1]|uniref:Uncharacterized protein n=1 Tax=Heterobasidion irregulare (strain TC 32-1) TaxID=747525 RepID=W4JUL6_HETIT|nr:uncharacterized protein HETIRDRAFT_105596 [Heterobasidion irregulare TC 32-1]ETW77237.1 hypothetical protein HETIRDRAFT_105596 [Heterobasidion irregulare TC 32-1]
MARSGADRLAQQLCNKQVSAPASLLHQDRSLGSSAPRNQSRSNPLTCAPSTRRVRTDPRALLDLGNQQEQTARTAVSCSQQDGCYEQDPTQPFDGPASDGVLSPLSDGAQSACGLSHPLVGALRRARSASWVGQSFSAARPDSATARRQLATALSERTMEDVNPWAIIASLAPTWGLAFALRSVHHVHGTDALPSSRPFLTGWLD